MATNSDSDPIRLTTTAIDDHGQAHRLLRIYLRDHDAGSAGGVRLVQRSHQSNRGTAFESGLAALESAIRKDQGELVRILQLLEILPSKPRRVLAWWAATLGGLKLNGHVMKYSPLSRVDEFEALSGAVTAKLRLWSALADLSMVGDRLDPSLLADLGRDARSQLDSLAKMHREATRLAFATPPKR